MQNSFPSSLVFVFICFFLVSILTGWMRKTLVKHSVLDIPNDRSLHISPVPRGGGVALLAVFLPVLIGGTVFLGIDMGRFGLIGAVFLLTLVSWIDDRKHVSPALRLFVHILAAFLGSFSFTPEEMLLGGKVPFLLDRFLMIVSWAWFMNLYNFMDGIDGITGVETVFIAVGLWFVSAAADIHDPFVSLLVLALTGSCLGFLVHNWHPAKIFLGDIGSVPLGFLVGFCLLSIAINGYPIAALILPLYYLADSGITLVRRASHGEKIWQAHREHYYQRAALSAGSHGKVVSYIIVANIGLVAAAIFSVLQPVTGLCMGVLIVGLLLEKMRRTATTHPSVPQKSESN